MSIAKDNHSTELRESIQSQETTLEHTHITRFTYILVICVCVGGFLFGYDTGVISGALQPLQDTFQLNTVQKELVVGGTTLGAIFGGFFCGMILVIVSSIIFIAGALLLALARSYPVLLLGRLVVGLGVGMASMIVPVYVSELAPKNIRGRLTTLNTLVITFGQVVAYIMNIAFANVDEGWRYMFGIAAIPALFQFIIMPFLPESPRRLVTNNQLDEAKSVFRKIYGDQVSDAFIDNEIQTMLEETSLSKGSTYGDLLKKNTLRPLLIACLLQAAQQLSGFNAAMYYAATILKMAGFRSRQNSTSVAIIVSVTNMVFTAVAVAVVDRAGRRRMVIVTMLMMVVGLVALGGTFAAQQGFIPRQDSCSGYVTHCSRCVLDDRCGWSISQNTCNSLAVLEADDIYQSPTGCPPRDNDRAITGVLVTSLIVYVASYALGLGYAPWLIQSEMFSNKVRGKANGVSTAVNWICNLIISTTFLSMTDTLTSAGTFWFYAAISFVLWIILYFILPETTGKSLEEVNESFR
ncbi:general substrate transporter [Spinellus fusiger]|nr:general substrate transporter [Spinellus fusiger]